MSSLSCGISSVTHSHWAHFLAWEGYILLVIALLIGYPLYGLLKKYRGIKVKIASWFFILILFAVFLILSVLILLLNFLGGVPPSHQYHVLNAAVKNTCYLDPQKNHCPKTVAELIAIDPERFTSLTNKANVTYEYYSDTNEYTLIVRNNGDSRVVIFDPRLMKAKNYGNGLDFVDTEIKGCSDGKYSLKSPPPFAGPWDQIR